MEFSIAEIYLKAYPIQIARVTESSIVWKDGTDMPLGDMREKTFQERLENSSLFDQISIPYIVGPEGIERLKKLIMTQEGCVILPFLKKYMEKQKKK